MAWLEFPSGWIPDTPDRRDFDAADERLRKRIRSAAPLEALEAEAPLQPSVDLGTWFPPIDSQVPLSSCTASAAAGLLGYFERKAFGNDVIPSRMFLYKVERNLLGQTGDHGAFLRTAMKALRAFGVAPEEYWPFDPSLLDAEPSAFEYAFAANYKAISYYRLDKPGMTNDELVESVKRTLASSFPVMFGIALYPSFEQAGDGRIPVPEPWEPRAMLHALVAAGYDDSIAIGASRGAFRIRNSWGTIWGEQGYGWLPYDYVRRGLTQDWWTLTKADYLDTGEFGPGTAPERR